MAITAAYYDGIHPVRRAATVALGPNSLRLTLAPNPAFDWRFDEVRLIEEDLGIHRFGRERAGTDTGERLEIADSGFAAQMMARCTALGGTKRDRRRQELRIFAWAVAAVASLVALIIFGMPFVATRLAPLVPWSAEVRLGAAVEDEVLRQLTDGTPRFCATTDGPGKRALDQMLARLLPHAPLPGEAIVRILDAPVKNAFALPGGRVVLLRGLIEAAETPDEVAGVLAHELGHVAHRDAMRGIIHAGGVSFLIGTLLGDFTGAGALIIASKFLLGNRHSRTNEREADTYAIAVMNGAGADARALGRFLGRIAAANNQRPLEFLLTHPVTADRVAAIDAGAASGTRPILSPSEWADLRAACRS
jgi:Zn-dependent protease with chaperone function